MSVSPAVLEVSEEAALLPRSLELFGGAGGLALGLKRAGFESRGIIESDVECCATLEANGRDGRSYTTNSPLFAENVVDFDYSGLAKVELLAAGAPCQPFSHGGRRRGARDKRNLFPQVIRALHDLDPQAFVIENVRGLLFREMEMFFKGLLRELRSPKRHFAPNVYSRRGRPRDEYVVFYRILNAADFGLPQCRQRLFIVGLRPELAETWNWPKPTHSKEALLSALLGDDYWQQHKVPRRIRDEVRSEIRLSTRKRLERLESPGERWHTARDLVADLPSPKHTQAKAGDPSHVFVPGARLYAKHTGSRLDWPAKTVKAGVHGCPGGEHIIVFDNGTHRYLTVRECALLQGFPGDYAFPQVRTQAMRQIGNAVPPAVGAAVASQVAEVLRRG